MTVELAAFQRRFTLPHPYQVGGVMCLALAVGYAAFGEGSFRAVVAAFVALIVLAVGITSRRRMLVVLIVWLAALGTVRRLLPQDAQIPGDPLLLVGPALLGLLFIDSVRRGALTNRSRLSNVALAFFGLTLLGAVNPLQGNLVTGFAGLLFFLVPQLGFWIGRELDDETFLAVVKTVAVLAPIVALYGLAQTIGLFPWWDVAWIKSVESSYRALFIGGAGGISVRAFSSFSAWAEYAAFIAIGIAAWIGMGMRRFGLILTAIVVGLLAAALVLESERTIVVTLLVAVALMVASRRGLPFRSAAVGAVALLSVLPLVTTPLSSAQLGSIPGGSLIQHQLLGFSDPGNSTLPVHFAEMVNGFQLAIGNPIGLGVGAVSIASAKFGGTAQLTEVDPSNAAVALGIPGLVLYLALVVVGLRSAYQLARRRRDPLAVIGLGIPVLMLLGWLNGGQYAVAFLPWLALGWVDRTYQHETTQ